MTEKQVNKTIEKKWYDTAITVKEIGESVGLSESSVRRRARALKLPERPTGGHNKITIEKSGDSLKDEIFKILLKSKKQFKISELSDRFDIGVSRVKSIIGELKSENKNINCVDDSVEIAPVVLAKDEPMVINARHLTGKKIRFGITSDNHLGSKYERLDVLNALYKRFAEEGIDTVYNAGNIIDGEARFNKFDIHKYGMEEQCKYFAQVFPKHEGIKTYFITGDDHEGWYVQREGVNIGKFMENKAREIGRDDLIYIGHMEHDIILKAPKGQAVMRIVHPGGGSSYAVSYTSQKLVESYSPGEKPHILIMGHYHKASYNYIRGVHVVQAGCTMDQSPFMRKKRLDAHVGGWIIEIEQGENGVIQKFSAEFIPFYSKEFYEKQDNWQYQF